MKISKAVSIALKQNKRISRKNDVFGHSLLPTNSQDCFVVFDAKNKPVARRWNPTAKDLISNDWFIVS